MNVDLTGKVAYVTGGARGIGAATTSVLAQAGARVAVSDVAIENLDWPEVGEPSLVVAADLATAEGCRDATQQVVDQLGPPDILVNNVGSAKNKPFEQLEDSDWEATIALNLMSHVRTSRAIVPAMASRGGVVVNVASDLAKQPETIPTDYGAMKAALLSVTKSLALEYAPAVRVNAVCPGPVWTDLWTRPGGVVDNLAEHYGASREDAVKRYLAERQLPLGIGKPDQVAGLIAFLASDSASWITGSAFDLGGTIRSLV